MTYDKNLSTLNKCEKQNVAEKCFKGGVLSWNIAWEIFDGKTHIEFCKTKQIKTLKKRYTKPCDNSKSEKGNKKFAEKYKRMEKGGKKKKKKSEEPREI